jgi:gliding motility-associated-like protein
LRKLLLILLILFSDRLQAQTSIGGQVNDYYAVSSVGVNTVTCAGEDITALQPGDKVMLFQVTGGMIDTISSSSWNKADGVVDSWHGSGRTELLAVNQVNYSGKVVTFTSDIKRTYDPAEKVQLIRIVESEIVTVDSEVSALSWNGTKGGVVAIVAFKKLVLNADIVVSGQGFRGGMPETYNGGCRTDYSTDTFYFKKTALDKAGNKGEGVFKASFDYLKGPGHALNGGGGALGLYGGGGGGGLYYRGGLGDYQDNSCPHSNSQQPYGGYGLDTLFFTRIYEANPDEKWPALTFGGGGGSSTENAGGSTTSGGNGGGIVLILTDTLVTNGYSIRSNGGSVSSIVDGGAAGGGAAGMVVVDADYIDGSLDVQLRGGNGGSANNSSGNCGGAGGGGAGGIYWFNGSVKPALVTYNFSGGARGTNACSPSDNYSTNGQQGKLLSSFKPLLNGFVFNAITGDDTICAGQVPGLILGTTPKGVLAPVYKWLESNDNISWSVISGAIEKDYQPAALSGSKYYTRVVTNDDSYSDTSYSVFVKVYPVISGNYLTLRDTICQGSSPGLLQANTVSGGDSNYDYLWESTDDLLYPAWTVRSTNELFTDNAVANRSIYYRRIVTSGKVCSDTSLSDTITALEQIEQNTILSPDTTICYGLDGGLIRTQIPTGGDGIYRYTWAISDDNITYTTIGGETSASYNPGGLTLVKYFKRVVFSGNGDVCVDSSNAHVIDVLPVINNLGISSDSTKYCYGDTPLALHGNPAISGGNGIYSYQWQILNGTVWEPVIGATGMDYLPPALSDTTWYKRSVISGDDDACKDTSNSLKIRVIPQINNVLQTVPADICENSVPELFNELPASQGAGGFLYTWQDRVSPSGGWTNAPGTNDAPSYVAGSLSQTTYYHRLVKSDICTDTSNEITVIVYPSIKQNQIVGGGHQYTCFNTQKVLSGSMPVDGNSSYKYKWEYSGDGTLWASVNGAGSKDYTTGKLTGNAYFRRIVLSGDTDQCKDTSDYVQVDILNLPTGDIVSKNDTLCQQDVIKIQYRNLTGVSPWLIEVGEGHVLRSEVVQDPEGSLVFPMEESANIRMLRLRDDSTCFADTSLNTGLVRVLVHELPIAYAGESKEVCGNSMKMEAIFSVDNSYGSWEISGGEVTPEGSPNGLLTVNEYGDHAILWRESTASDCFSEDEISITFYEQPQEIHAGKDIQEDYRFVYQLNATPADVGAGYWKFVQGDGTLVFDDSTLYNATATVSDEGAYYLEWNIENGVCEPITDELVITNKPQQIYQGFSPNGDGINDEYIVKLQETHDGELIILDKNGRVVRKVKSIEHIITWDGKSDSGIELPEGTYYYILNEDGVHGKSGFIELRKYY